MNYIKNKPNFLRSFAFILISFILLLLFQNCDNGFNTNTSDVSAKLCEPATPSIEINMQSTQTVESQSSYRLTLNNQSFDTCSGNLDFEALDKILKLSINNSDLQAANLDLLLETKASCSTSIPWKEMSMFTQTRINTNSQGLSCGQVNLNVGPIKATPQLVENVLSQGWFQTIDSATTDSRIDIDGIDVSPSGLTYISGYISGEGSIGRQTPVQISGNTEPMSGLNTKNIFIAGLSAQGNLNFSRVFLSSGFEGNGYDLKADGNGNFYVSGAFSGDVNFGANFNLSSTCSFGVPVGNSGANGQMFLAKFNSLGQTQWAVQADSSSLVSGGNEVTLDSNENIIQFGLMGAPSDSTPSNQIFGCDDDPQPQLTINQSTNLNYDVGLGGFDSYVTVFNKNNGALLAGHTPVRFGGVGLQRGKAIEAADDVASQKTYIFGVDYIGPTIIYTRTGSTDLNVTQDRVSAIPYSQRMLVGRATYDGQLLWHKKFGSNNDDQVKGVTFDSLGHVLVSGTASGDINGDFTIPQPSNLQSATSFGFVMKLNGLNGDLIWVRTFGSEVSAEFCCEISVDPFDNVYVGTNATGENFYFSNESEPLALVNSNSTQPYAIHLSVNTFGQLLQVFSMPHANSQTRTTSSELVYQNGSLYITPPLRGVLNISPGNQFITPSDGFNESELVIRIPLID